ncbi:MAG: prepilin peptidase [Phycisphaerae bacterium]|jgi:leader peptidase (prepilin peptidase)/N-methyltransferase
MLIIPDWLLIAFLAAFGASVGSFLNVVVYRLPRDLSLVRPRSMCPSCKTMISFYDNIPILSWLILLGKCRKCKAKISPRYIIIEFLTAALFVAVYIIYFQTSLRKGAGGFLDSGYLLYAIHIIMLSALLAASAIDLELWVIPLSICWFVTALGLVGSAAAGFVYDPTIIKGYDLFPTASANIAILAAGALAGFLISLLLLFTGVIKESYGGQNSEGINQPSTENYKHRLEMLKEVIYLLPIIICSYAAFKLYGRFPRFADWWIDFSQQPVVSGLAGSLWGYFIGCGVVWTTRILGTLAFGREAMGLGDVHLMGAAGAVLGAWPVVVAFFVAPFFGLLWAAFSMFFKKTRQIPYGPFLSMGLFLVMIIHDVVINWLQVVLHR